MRSQFIKITILTLMIFAKVTGFSQMNTEKLIQNLENYIEEKNIPSAMISIVRSDTTLFVGGIGAANIEKNEIASAQHLYRLGSISKSFTALGLYILLKKSSYSINSSLKEIDPTIPYINKWEKENPVKVSHILEHTSGFEDFHLHAIYNSKNEKLPALMEMVKDHKQSLKSRWKPGDKKAYSNPNYILAGHLIEQLSEKAFDRYIYENILQPINMKSSGFYFKQPKNTLFAQGYRRIGTDLTPIPFTTINGASAGDFCSNAADMATFLQFMLNRDSTLFSKKEFDRIETPQTSIAAKNGLKYGYGLGNYSIWKNGYLFHGHGGEIDGFASRYMYSREADLGVVVAINRNGNANAMVDEILEYLLGKEEKANPNRITYPIPEELKTKFAGFYEFKSPKSELIGFTDRMFAGLTLDFQSDKLITRTILGKVKDTLSYAGNNQFYLNNESEPSAMLIDSDGKKAAFWINDNYTERESRLRRLIIFFGLLLSFLLVISYLIYALGWFAYRLFKKEKTSWTNRLFLFGAVLSLFLMFTGFGFTMANVQTANSVNFSSLLMYVSSYIMVILSFVSIWKWFKLSNKKGFDIYYFLVSVAMLVISTYLWDIGLVGLKLWCY